jgi:hypothetical protein
MEMHTLYRHEIGKLEQHPRRSSFAACNEAATRNRPSSSVVDNPKIERVSLIGHPLMRMLPGGARLEARRQSTCAIRTDARTVIESLDRFN